MQSIQTSDVCCVCMDEMNRDFLYKTCCTLIVCRKCYNQLEVESFPNHSTCPGCRQAFSKIGYSVEVINNVVVPRAYCGMALPAIQSLKEHDEHVLSCVECLKKVIKGNSWFEKQIIEKFAGIKRKLQTVEDEVFVRNQRIRELSHDNAFMAREISRQSVVLDRLIEGRRTVSVTRRQLFTTEENLPLTPLSVSNTELLTTDDEETDGEADESSVGEHQDPAAPSTPPRSSSARTTPPLAPLRRRGIRTN